MYVSCSAGMGGLNHLLAPGGSSHRHAAKSAVKAKMASGKSPEPRQNLKAITNTTATTAKGELLRHSKTAAHKSSPSTVLLQDDGAQKSPKECWVRVNKNMVANLVENLVETSLCRDDAYCLSGTASIDDSECLEARRPDAVTSSLPYPEDNTTTAITVAAAATTNRNNDNRGGAGASDDSVNSDDVVVDQHDNTDNNCASDNEIDVENADLQNESRFLAAKASMTSAPPLRDTTPKHFTTTSTTRDEVESF